MFDLKFSLNRSNFIRWLPLAFLATALTGLIYVGVQQNYRQSANDPQEQMVEDSVAQLNAGITAAELTPSHKINIAASLAPFMIIYNASGSVIASDARLNGHVPQLPNGVLKYARNHGSDIITWQPQSNVRIAAAVQPYNHGYVLAGRNLRQVEKREDQLSLVLAVGWIVTVIGTFVLCCLS